MMLGVLPSHDRGWLCQHDGQLNLDQVCDGLLLSRRFRFLTQLERSFPS